MQENSIILSVTFPIPVEQLYTAWLDSKQHSAMTGGEAHCSDQLGEAFTAWDGYITGKNLRLDPGIRIIQSWRTMDFQEDDSFSRLELRFESVNLGSQLTLLHSEIPDGQPDYARGWEEHYFAPMRAYFSA